MAKFITVSSGGVDARIEWLKLLHRETNFDRKFLNKYTGSKGSVAPIQVDRSLKKNKGEKVKYDLKPENIIYEFTETNHLIC